MCGKKKFLHVKQAGPQSGYTGTFCCQAPMWTVPREVQGWP